jgi:CubicO group peptidase (beta-lactamase class C family)
MIDFKDLEETILRELEETQTPGATLALVKGDEIVYSNGFGKSTIQENAPITPDSILRTASVGKIFTAVVVSQFVQQGKLQWNVPIRNYLKGLSSRISELTLHQLLTHTAGLRDAFRFKGSADDQALRETVLSWKDDLFFQEPDKFFSYSNYGYSIAGLVIEELSGESYAAALEKMLFEPAGMRHTTFPAVLANGICDSVVEGEKAKKYHGFRDHAAFRPVGFHISTVNDLARFLTVILNKGKVDEQQVFSPCVFERLCLPRVHALSHPSAIHYSNPMYGYGVIMHEFRGVQVVEHPGQLPGFGCRLLWAPDFQFGIAVMTNATGVTLTKSVERAMELFLPLQAKREMRDEIPVTEDEIQNFVGFYRNPAKSDQVAEIFIRNGKLVIKDWDKEYPLKKIGPYHFANAFEPDSSIGDFVLIPDSIGKITHRHKGFRAWPRVNVSDGSRTLGV